MEEGFQSLQQEVDIKTKKLKKVGKGHIRTIFWNCDSKQSMVPLCQF